jgi:transcription elongation factor Elf1
MKWKDIDKVKHDKQQTTLDNTTKKIATPQQKVNYNTKVYCPFCLYYNKLNTFILVDTKEYKLKCPECGNIMLMRTLKAMTRMTKTKVQAYAKWCFMYRLSGFWDKVNKPVWNRRLKEYNWAGPFWVTYKKLRGDTGGNKLYNEEDDYSSAREERIRQKIERGEYG